MGQTKANLTGVPETMLWTLHNRAAESLRAGSGFSDPEAERIYQAIDYDYEGSFGPPDGSHAARSQQFDGFLRAFLGAHPDGVIVNLGEGLETQRYRVKGEGALWISVDLPGAIAAREQFIQPDAQHLHLSMSALDARWMDAVPADRAVYITAQGLLMYFTEEQVSSHLQLLAARFPGGRYAFDVIPPWLVWMTTRPGGWMKTKRYRAPPMPWGIRRGAIRGTLGRWLPALKELQLEPFARLPKIGFPAGWATHYGLYWASMTPGLRELGPSVVRLLF